MDFVLPGWLAQNNNDGFEKQSYGNMKGDEYLEWFSSLTPKFSEMLADNGSIVIEMGSNNAEGIEITFFAHENDGEIVSIDSEAE